MARDRSVIVHLLAAGRIDPAQAERLLAVLSADRETIWALGACLAIAIGAQLPGMGPVVVHLLRAGLPVVHSVVASLGGLV
jgi:hypothetical protein